MAMGARPDNNTCFGVDPSASGAIKHCNGWMYSFKNFTSTLPCVDFAGEKTNCWDVIDAIQIHAYARTAQEVLDKIRDYREVFAEDIEGRNGRTRKTLWLTEVAAASSNGTFVTGFVNDLLSNSTGLMNRTEFSYITHVSHKQPPCAGDV